MFSTRLTRRFRLATPIVNAGMAMIARPPLAAAVSNAGGLGTIGCDISPPDTLRQLVHATQMLTDRPFGVDLIGDFATDEHVDVLCEERVPLVIYFWAAPQPAHLKRLQAAGAQVWMQIGSVQEARDAVALGVDGLVVQGAEAGGHNRAEASTMTLFPRVRRLFPQLTLLAAGGIVDGPTLAAALVLGADGVWCGSRFLAAAEANAHADYQARVLAADVGDTVITSIYGPEWPDQPVRAIVNRGLRSALGREVDALREAEGETMGHLHVGDELLPLPRYSAILPMPGFVGDIEMACLTAGQSAGNIDRVEPAGQIVRRMTDEAAQALQALGSQALPARDAAPALSAA